MSTPELVIDSFHDVEPVDCPCGDSHRIKLSKHGWPIDCHLTKIRGVADGHQHKRTTESYFVHRVHGRATMTVGEKKLELKEGMLIAIPNGTMHSVEGDVDVFIIVGGGHKDDDFWDQDWQPLS